MANLPGEQLQILHCPICTEQLRNIPRNEMRSRGYERADGTISPETHLSMHILQQSV